jgi:flagellar protein FliL
MAKKDKKKEDEQEEAKDEKEEKDDAKEKDEPAEGEAGEGGEEGAAPKKSKKKIIIIGVLALFVLLGGVTGAYFAGLFGKSEEKVEGMIGPDGKPIVQAVYYTLPEFLVNLNSGGKQTSFLKTTVILELSSQLDVVRVEANLPRLLDAFNTYLRELRASDLAGSAGIQRLREELLLRANKALAPLKVNDVLFKEIVVQ